MNHRFFPPICSALGRIFRENKFRVGLLLGVSFIFFVAQPVAAQTTAFTYQGRLNEGANSANGLYDLRFAIFDAASGGAQQGNALINSATGVTNGLFTVALDFGASVFDGSARWLEISVRTNGNGAFTNLAPRQPMTSTPYAVRALTAGGVPAGAITSAMLAPGSASANLAAGGISGVAPGGVVMSEQEFATNLLNQGYVRLGKVNLVSESWRVLTNGPALGTIMVSPRYNYAAVWTGTEYLIWGGQDASGPLNSGGRYNPTTDVWTPMSLSNAPSPQVSPAAVWTGTNMVVWGNNGPVRGGRYNPTTDSWLPLSETNAPSTRSDSSVVWTGTYMIIWGGFFSAYLNNGARYDPVNNVWSAVQATGAPSARGQHSAVWTGTEMIIWGGHESHGCGFLCVTSTNFFDGARYNPTSDSWQPMTSVSAPLKRYAHSAVWSGTEMIVWGGLSGSDGNLVTFFTNINTGARYNPTLNQWTAATSLTGAPSARDSHFAHWTGNRMLIWGGQISSTATNDGALYNPVNNSWAAMSSLGAPPVRGGNKSVWTGTQFLLWSGLDAPTGIPSAFGQRYTAATDAWSAMSPSGDPSARVDHTAVWAGTEMLGWGGLGNEFPLRSGGRLNPSATPTNMWSPIPITGAPGPRTDHTAVWTGSEMMVWGGFNAGQALNTGGRYTPALNSWTTISTTGAPSPRSRHVAVWTGNQWLIWGGFDGTNFLATGGRYNPSANTWQSISTVNAPAARADTTAVWTGSEMIIWGGRTVIAGVTNFLNTGARYDPVANVWQTVTTTGSPVARYDHTSVWSGNEMIVWGGETAAGKTNSGARYQPALNQWVPLNAPGAPSSRSQHTTVWAGTQMIVWGGTDGNTELNTGGSYDPVRDVWNATLIGTNALPTRQRHSAVWSGTEMIVWAGAQVSGTNLLFFNDAYAYTPGRVLYLYLRP